MKNSIRIINKGEVALVEFDQENSKVNKWSSSMMKRLQEVVNELKLSSFKAIIFISRKPKNFVAGADIDEIRALNTIEAFDHAVAEGQRIFNEIEDLPQVTIAAINGAAVGGGCEFALACDYRIATEDNSTRIGLPEVKLGIIPGFGGCVRLPKLIGLQAALDIILSGKLLNSKKAEKVGLVDQVVHENYLESAALKIAQEKIGQKRRNFFKPKGVLNQFLESPIGRVLVFKKAKETILKSTHGHYPAPLAALEAIRLTYKSTDRNYSMSIERAHFCKVATTDVSKNLIHVFDLTEMVKKQSGIRGVQVKPREIHHLGILGAGTMGGGIAFVAADKGIEVRMKDIHFEAVMRGIKHARSLWTKLVKKRVITQYDLEQKVSRVSGGVTYADFKRSDLVVEAIVEDIDIKKKVLSELADHIGNQTIVVTNTSSLSVNEMQSAFPRPELFAGMHFFNPVDKMPLVEVIRGEKTSDETIATVFELSKRMGKMPVVVKDGPGFLVNRLLLPYMAEAAFLLQEGQDIEMVDRVYVKIFGMPMGPFALMDEVGLDVCLKVLKIFKKAFGERIEIAPSMLKLESLKNRLGKKSGLGFYKYNEKGYRTEVDKLIYSELGLGNPSNPIGSEACIERGVFSMINECARAMVSDQIVHSAAEADLAMIMGTGFPPFRGGLLKYADHTGIHLIIEKLDTYSKTAPRLRVSDELKTVLSKGGFYSMFPAS